MNWNTVDRLVAFLVISLIVFGTYNWWLVYRRTQITNPIVKVPISGLFGIDPVWYVISTLVGVPVLVGGYFAIRRAGESA